MNDAYQHSLNVERRGKERLRPFLDEQADGGMVIDVRGSNALGIKIQKEWGDYLVDHRTNGLLSLELKVDDTDLPTVAIELWSNLIVGDYSSYLNRGHTPGWLLTNRAKLLLYYWMRQDKLAVIPMYELQTWALNPGSDGVPAIERHQLDRMHSPGAQFPYKQPHARQPNRTLIRCVPLPVLERELKPRPLIVKVEQLYLPYMAPNIFAGVA